jgi:hypothetical protein
MQELMENLLGGGESNIYDSIFNEPLDFSD